MSLNRKTDPGSRVYRCTEELLGRNAVFETFLEAEGSARPTSRS